jgi:hypothetical protein
MLQGLNCHLPIRCGRPRAATDPSQCPVLTVSNTPISRNGFSACRRSPGTTETIACGLFGDGERGGRRRAAALVRGEGAPARPGEAHAKGGDAAAVRAGREVVQPDGCVLSAFAGWAVTLIVSARGLSRGTCCGVTVMEIVGSGFSPAHHANRL